MQCKNNNRTRRTRGDGSIELPLLGGGMQIFILGRSDQTGQIHQGLGGKFLLGGQYRQQG